MLVNDDGDDDNDDGDEAEEEEEEEEGIAGRDGFSESVRRSCAISASDYQ